MKKCNKWLSVLLVLALALSLFGGMTVWAEGDEDVGDPADEPAVLTNETGGTDEQNDPLGGKTATPEPTSTVTPEAAAGPVIVKYSDIGYSIKKGQHFNIEIVVSDPRVLNGEVSATVNCSAFVRRSGPVTVNTNSEGQYTLSLTDIEYIGGMPELSVDISYPGTGLSYSTIHLTLNQCEDTPDPTPTPEPTATPEPNYKTPGIIIKQSSFGDAPQVQAGAEFTLTLTVFTTTGTENLTDVLVELALPKDVSLATGNLNTYIGEMGPEATRTVTYQILPSATFVDGVANIGVSMSGIGQHTGSTTSGSTSISVPVVQPERFEITNIEAPEMMMLGEEGYVSITFVNKGKTPISNLSAEIMGDNLANPGQSQFLGNIAAGTENSVDFNVLAEHAGVINATVVLSYEDDAGNVKTLQKTFSCTIEEMPMFEDPGFYDPGFDMGDFEEPKAGMPWWGWVLILLAVGGGAAAVVIVLKKRKAKKALAELEDQDEDI